MNDITLFDILLISEIVTTFLRSDIISIDIMIMIKLIKMYLIQLTDPLLPNIKESLHKYLEFKFISTIQHIL